MVGVIAKLRHFVPMSTTLNIYNCLILPHITYGINVWGLATKVHLSKILKLQKRVLRIINFGQYRSPVIPFFISVNVLPVNMLYFISVSMPMHYVYNNKTLANISNLFTPACEVNMYNTRFSSTSNFYVRNSRINNSQGRESEYGIVFLTNCVILVKENLRKNCKKFYFLYLLRRIIILMSP